MSIRADNVLPGFLLAQTVVRELLALVDATTAKSVQQMRQQCMAAVKDSLLVRRKGSALASLRASAVTTQTYKLTSLSGERGAREASLLRAQHAAGRGGEGGDAAGAVPRLGSRPSSQLGPLGF